METPIYCLLFSHAFLSANTLICLIGYDECTRSCQPKGFETPPGPLYAGQKASRRTRRQDKQPRYLTADECLAQSPALRAANLGVSDKSPDDRAQDLTLIFDTVVWKHQKSSSFHLIEVSGVSPSGASPPPPPPCTRYFTLPPRGIRTRERLTPRPIPCTTCPWL